MAVILAMAFLPEPSSAASSKEKKHEQEQVKLDQACEVARQKKLIPERQKYIEQCVKEGKPRPDRESCERFYADYGAQSGNRAPLYYDLPECEAAFEHRQNN
jgi:hypothetical protein